MKKYAIILTAALFVCAFSGCDEEATLPYIPVEKPDNNTPPEGDDPDTYTVEMDTFTLKNPTRPGYTYRLDKVLLCAPENPNGTDIYGKLDYFPSLRMTLNVSPLATTVTFDNGDIPFVPFPEALSEGPIQCVLDSNVIPNVLRVKGSDTVIATFDADGFTTQFQLDSKLLTYKYKFKSL